MKSRQTYPALLAACALLLISFSASGTAARSDKETSASKKSLVSLAPSNTELIYSIGGEDSLKGVSTYCLYPPAARSKPRAGSFIAARYETLAHLKPDTVLLVSGQELLDSQIKRHGYRTILLPNHKLTDLADNLRTLGELTGRKESADRLARKFRRRQSELQSILAGHKRPRLLMCVWPNPCICAGSESFLDDIITSCGGTNAAGAIKGSYPKLSAEKIVALKPDIVILPYEARDGHLLKRPPFSSLKAVKDGRFFYLPDQDHDMLAKPTLRVLQGMHWLSVRLHPDLKSRLDAWAKL
ncbi:MAG: ABC transporter substrate-binding protein [Cyanobacteria bacterium HKST-UBA02]|nr:ABC transporter substrate-binding protein [Cyanobacteria bacterium HKST-UBA02]